MMFSKIINKLFPPSEGVKAIGKHMIDNPFDWIQLGDRFINIGNKDIQIVTTTVFEIGVCLSVEWSISEKIYIKNCIKQSIGNRFLYSKTDFKNEK